MTNYDFGNNHAQHSRRPTPIWQKYTRRGKEAIAQDTKYNEFIQPYVRDLRLNGKYSEKTLNSLLDPKAEDINHELMASLIHYIHVNEGPGAILVFLPGWANISAMNTLLSRLPNVQIFPAHSMMPTAQQKMIFEKPPVGVRKIVLATQIAETSITIDDVVYVVNCGKIKYAKFDTKKNLTTLQPEWVCFI